MILKKKHITFFIFILITLALKNISATPLCSEEDINIENKEVASNEESSEENIEIIENKNNNQEEKKEKKKAKKGK